jgi:hypothetical protein
MQRTLPGVGLAVAVVLTACADPSAANPNPASTSTPTSPPTSPSTSPSTSPPTSPSTSPSTSPPTSAPTSAPVPGGRCDQAALKTAADATDAMLAAWRPASGVAPDYRLAVRGLRAACPKLAPGFEFYLEYSVHPASSDRSARLKMTVPLRDDPDGLGPLLAHCPGFHDVMARANQLPGDQRLAVVYEGCDFAAIGLFTRAELSPGLDDPQAFHGHALYLWLLADGAPPAVARSLARPITAGSEFGLRDLSGSDEPLVFPAAATGVAPPAFADPLRISPDGIRFDGRRLAYLTGGQLAESDFNKGLIGAVFDTLAEEVDKTRTLADKDLALAPALAIVADPKIPWATVGRAAWTAMRAEYPRIDVRALGPDPLRPLLTVPLFTRGAAPTLDLVVAADSLTLHCADASHKLDLAALPAKISACGGGPLRLVGVAGTAWQRVVDVLSALAGTATITDIAPEPLATAP